MDNANNEESLNIWQQNINKSPTGQHDLISSGTVGSKTVAMFGYFALHAMWSLIAWESLLALAEWIEVFDLGFLLVFRLCDLV